MKQTQALNKSDQTVLSMKKQISKLRIKVMPFFYELVYGLITPRNTSCMNLGYAPATESLALLYFSNHERFQYELYWQTFQQIDEALPASSVVCEVGCGRGGGLAFLKKFTPATLIGLERSLFARRVARKKFGLDVRPTTAPQLALPDASVDVFLLIESAHNYHNDALVSELERCLKPGGQILLADFNLGSNENIQRKLTKIYKNRGLTIENWRDVRPNILDSMRQDEPRKLALLKYIPSFLKDEARGFMGLVGSYKYTEMATDKRAYFIFKARKQVAGGFKSEVQHRDDNA